MEVKQSASLERESLMITSILGPTKGQLWLACLPSHSVWHNNLRVIALLIEVWLLLTTGKPSSTNIDDKNV